MAKFLRIPMSSIHIGERQRPIDEEHALAIAASMDERGLINPITVRSTPNQNGGKTPFTLVAGGHRHWGAGHLGWDEIDAMMVAADATEAVLIEIAENIFRNDLTALNRALFVAKYRETWEELHPIQRGGDRKSKRHDGGLIFAAGRELSARVQSRLGISGRTYERINQIAVHLHPDLRQALRGTDIEDDQAKLLKLAKLDVPLQVKAAAMMREGADFKATVAKLLPRPAAPAVDPQATIFERLSALWADADKATQRRFLDEVVSADDWSLLETAA